MHRIREREGNTEVSWLNGASDLITVTKSFQTGGSAIQNKDWATLGASAGTIVGKGLIYASKQWTKLVDVLKTDAVKKALPTPTAIVDAAALAVTLVDFLNGFGSPNSGSAVSTAAKDLDLFVTSLDPGCVPDPRDWAGPAAAAYIAQNADLKRYTQDLKLLDDKLKNFIAEQAGNTKEAHMCCAVNVAVLTAAAGVALLLYLIPVTGPAWSQAWQIIAAFACCAAVLVVELLEVARSMTLNNQVATLAKDYVTLGENVQKALEGSFGKIEGKVAAEASSKLSSFRGISDGLTKFSFAPSINDLANQAGDRVTREQREFLDANRQQQGLAAKSPAGSEAPRAPQATPAAVPAAAAAAATPATAAAATPAAAPAATSAAAAGYAPPTLAQMAAMSAQISQMSQPVSQLGQTVNQGVSQIQQAAQSGKGPGDPAPPPADAAGDGQDAEAGAAAGSEGAERAPVDAATSGDKPTGAGRERVL